MADEETRQRNEGWRTPGDVWEHLKPLARQHRREPTGAEAALWAALRGGRLRGAKFRRQHPVGRFIVDFYCGKASLVVEIDGSVHDLTGQADLVREAFLREQGLRLLRFNNEDVLHNLEAVLNTIESAL